MFIELKSLDVEEYRNATAVLFRVFLELTLDHIIEEAKQDARASGPILTIDDRAQLRIKIGVVRKYFTSQGIMTKEQLKPLEKAESSQDLVTQNVSIFNAYVHSRNLAPTTSDLKVTWDNFQLFFENVWK